MSNYQSPQWNDDGEGLVPPPPPGALPPPPLPQRTDPPENRRTKWFFAIGGAILGMIVMAVGTPSEPATISATAPTVTKTVPGPAITTPGPTVTHEVPGPAKTVTVKAEPPKPSVAFGEGDYLVGDDIKPGKYKTAEPVGEMCYWGIYRGGSNHEDIIQNNVVTGGIPRVTLREGQEFSSNGCGEWVKA